METPINAPPDAQQSDMPRYGRVLSGRTKDQELYDYLQALGKGKAKWIEAACFVAKRIETKKGISILEQAAMYREMDAKAAEVESTETQQQ